MTLKLPTEKKKPINDLSSASLLFFGGDKVGKTAFAAQFPNHFMLEFNPGNANHLERNSVDVHSWEEAIEYLRALAATENYCKTLIIDEISRFYSCCYKFVRKQLKKMPTEKDDFDVWRTVRNLFSDTLLDIQKLNCGKIYLANEEIQTVKTRTGREINTLDINLNPQGRDLMHGISNLRGYMCVEKGGERKLIVDGDDAYNIGHSFSRNFLWNGERLCEFSLSYSPEEAYANFIKAFNNQLPGKTIDRPKQASPKLVIKK